MVWLVQSRPVHCCGSRQSRARRGGVGRGCHWIAVQQQHDGQQWPDDGVEAQARTKWAA